MSSFKLRQLPDLLGLGFRQNIMSKVNPSVQFSRSIEDHLVSIDTDFEKEPFYRNMQLDKLFDNKINTDLKQKNLHTGSRHINISDGDIHWGENISYKAKRGIKLIDYYQPHNNLSLYENYFTRKNRLGDLAFLNCLTPVGFTVTKDTEITVDYCSTAWNTLDCNIVVVDISRNKYVTLLERFDCKNTMLTRIFYIVREGATLELNRDLVDFKQDSNVIESYVIQHPKSNVWIYQSAGKGHYVQTTFDFDIYNKCKTNIISRHNLEGNTINNVSVDVNHLGEDSKSNIDVKSVGDDSSYFSFRGNINVIKKAEGISADMTNKNLLVSDTATAITEPMLDINTKEIECSHGCTISNVDEDSLYYLQARGFTKEAATNILIENFLYVDHERVV